ncbi:MAG: LysM peptidoglycan-binding domain-containing protein [Bacilli bacterium]|nr:LysM peptidoglycan-binding domain-containing protein [Bacilli bacterium]MDD4795612.1 LysM peptidoglycan-binding domain-containing protein [Bacilli bacterium]
MITYQVLKGDTLWNIAMMHGVLLDELIAANPNINNPNLIYPGQLINIPRHVNNSTYTTMPGDTMWNIAKKHGLSLNNLASANPQIKNTSIIYPGQIINIPSTAETPSTSTPTSDEIINLENEVFRLANEERRRAGLPVLSLDSEITKVARAKSEDFINNNYFAHNSPQYGSPFEMLRNFGINYSAAAENIASGQNNAEGAINHWMNSAGHRANILNSTFNKTGVGVARDQNGNLYWTQLFVRN